MQCIAHKKRSRQNKERFSSRFRVEYFIIRTVGSAVDFYVFCSL